MPVHGLWGLLRSRGLLREVSDDAELRELLEGKAVAIDLSIWVVEGDAQSTKIIGNGGRIRPSFFLLLCFFRVNHFLRLGFRPVGVMEGACPPSKLRRRQRNGEHSQRIDQVAMIFKALGCPVVRARSEAEGLCAQLSRQGVVDAVASADSDAFPFGADGVVLKAAKLGSAWQVADVREVQEALGLSQQGFIALAIFAGCDFTQGASSVGAEKTLRCVRGLQSRCGDGSMQQQLLDLVSGDPPDFAQLGLLRGCQTCRRCGHGPPKRAHGGKGCKCCGTESGCELRTSPCPCDFSRSQRRGRARAFSVGVDDGAGACHLGCVR